MLNGRAPLNCTLNNAFNAAEGTTSVNGSCQGVGEGGSGLYGGNDPDDDSGVLRFVRIEFAGKRIQDGTTGLENELNGVAFQGVGRGTTVDYLHVHRGQDDGVEFFGGTVDVKHVLITCADDDSFDWTGGFAGRAQFVMLQQCGGVGDNGVEADNRGLLGNDFSPRSRPVIANLTAVGLNDAVAVGKSKAGALVREGTNVTLANSVFTGFNGDCLDIDQAATFAQAGTDDGTTFTPAVDDNDVRFVDFPGTVLSCASSFEVEASESSLPPVERVFLSSTDASTTTFAANGLFPNAFVGVDATGNQSRFVPLVASPLRTGAVAFTDIYAADHGAFFEAVTYRGAVDPAADWTVGWTAFPAN